MKTITICSSAAFYRQAIDIQAKLQAKGLAVVVPATATTMKERDDFDVSHYKTWYSDADDYHKKTALMSAHFDEINKGDTILVLNYEKHGIPNYIGGNVLVEMALAFYLKKGIYILNDVPTDSPFVEEIIGLGPIILKGDLEQMIDDSNN